MTPGWARIQWSATAALSLLAVFGILSVGEASERPILWGLSLSRLLAVAVPLAALLFSVALLLLGLRPRPKGKEPLEQILDWADGKPAAQLLAVSAVGVGILAVCVPGYRLGPFEALGTRLQPLLLWVGALGLQLLALRWCRGRADIYRWAAEWSTKNRSALLLAGAILLTLAILGPILLAALARIPGYEDFRYEPGAPVLPLQAAVSVLAGILFYKIVEPRLPGNQPRSDAALFVILWALAAMYWAATPGPYSYMNPAPLPPNEEVYPYSDAARYDLQAQAALLGQGLNSSRAVDNPLYPTLLAVIHAVSGQDFETNMAVQAAILAVLPAMAFLIGKRLHSRPLGVSAALMAAFQGANSISAAGLINLASPKQMLTDFPEAIAIALVCVTALSLLAKRDPARSTALWHGGAVGLAFLIRPTGLATIATVPIAFLIQKLKVRRWIQLVLVVGAGFVLVLSPWGIRNQLVGGGAFEVYFSKLRLVTSTRYREFSQRQRPPTPAAPVAPTESESTPATPDRPVSAFARGDSAQTSAVPVALVVSKHLANNLMGSMLILPTSAVFDDLQHVLKSPDSVWARGWTGSLNAGQLAGLLTSLAILAWGGAVLWRGRGAMAAAPALVFAMYQLANSVGRSSGGRFVVPIDWILLIYFSAGLLAIFQVPDSVPRLRRSGSLINAVVRPRATLIALVGLVLLGASPVLVERLFPMRYEKGAAHEAMVASLSREALVEAGYTSEEAEAFLPSRGAISLLGRAMYPRWFSYRALARETEGGLEGISFPHLEFYLLTPSLGVERVYVFTPTQVSLPNTSDALVIGCKVGRLGYIDALAVKAAAGEPPLIMRTSLDGLNCPQPPPVCDGNGNCR